MLMVVIESEFFENLMLTLLLQVLGVLYEVLLQNFVRHPGKLIHQKSSALLLPIDRLRLPFLQGQHGGITAVAILQGLVRLLAE